MSKRFVSQQAKPQTSDILKSAGLLQRSRAPAIVTEQDHLSAPSAAAMIHPLRESGFQRDFSHVPARSAMSLPIQAKLTVGQPGDRYEQEADRVADQVMQPPKSATSAWPVQRVPAIEQLQPEPDSPLRRQPAAEEDKKKVAKETAYKAEMKKQQAEKEKVTADEKAVKADKDKHEQEKKKKDDDKVQTQAQLGQVPTVTPALENHLNTRQGGGQSLTDSTRAMMESRFQHDFSQVRVHTDPQATRALKAQAFTRRHDIFFNQAQYQPEAPVGQRLLAHELTHVVQQGAAPVKSRHEIR